MEPVKTSTLSSIEGLLRPHSDCDYCQPAIIQGKTIVCPGEYGCSIAINELSTRGFPVAEILRLYAGIHWDRLEQIQK